MSNLPTEGLRKIPSVFSASSKSLINETGLRKAFTTVVSGALPNWKLACLP
jgi:hypothetical protein